MQSTAAWRHRGTGELVERALAAAAAAGNHDNARALLEQADSLEAREGTGAGEDTRMAIRHRLEQLRIAKAGVANADGQAYQMALAEAQRGYLFESTGLNANLIHPAQLGGETDWQALQQVRADLLAGNYDKVDQALAAEAARLRGARKSGYAKRVEAAQAKIRRAVASRNADTLPALARIGPGQRDGSLQVVDHTGARYTLSWNAGVVTVSGERGSLSASGGSDNASATQLARELAAQLPGGRPRANRQAVPLEPAGGKNRAVLGRGRAPRKTPGERLQDQLTAAQQKYDAANAAYQSALLQATGPGGAFDPRSSEAHEAESPRQQMVSARSELTKARLAAEARRLRPPPEVPHGVEALAAVRLPGNRKVVISAGPHNVAHLGFAQNAGGRILIRKTRDGPPVAMEPHAEVNAIHDVAGRAGGSRTFYEREQGFVNVADGGSARTEAAAQAEPAATAAAADQQLIESTDPGKTASTMTTAQLREAHYALVNSSDHDSGDQAQQAASAELCRRAYAGDKEAKRIAGIRRLADGSEHVLAEGSHNGVSYQHVMRRVPGTIGTTESYRLTYGGQMSQGLPRGRSVREAADAWRADIDAQPARRDAAQSAQRAALDETARAMLGRDLALQERNPLSYSQVVDAWQRANGCQPPMTILRQWAHSGVTDTERESAWYQAGLRGAGGVRIAADAPSTDTSEPGKALEAEL